MDGHILQAVSKKYTFFLIFSCCILILLPSLNSKEVKKFALRGK